MTRKRKFLVFLFLPLGSVLAALIGTSLVRFAQEPGREIGARGTAVLRSADRVETFRLDDGGYGDNVKQGTSGDVIAAKLSRAVLDPRTFIGPNDNTCEINPGVAFRAWRGQECVEVILCFHCQQMLVTTRNAQGKETHSAYTELALTREKFLALAKEAFPVDKEIQSLI